MASIATGKIPPKRHAANDSMMSFALSKPLIGTCYVGDRFDEHK